MTSWSLNFKTVNWPRDWFDWWFAGPKHVVELYHFADGSRGKRIPERGVMRFCSDGTIVTCASVEPIGAPRSVDYERWTPEAETPPWWLWGVTVVGAAVVGWRWRRGAPAR